MLGSSSIPRAPALCMIAVLAGVTVAIPSPAFAGLFDATDSIAKAWIGHDATDLLMQWPVDADVNFSTKEDLASKETIYNYRVIQAAYTTTQTWTESTGKVIGEYTSGTGAGAAKMPVFEQVERSSQTYHPAQLLCDFSFIADANGMIARYQVNDGNNCGAQLRKWGRPE